MSSRSKPVLSWLRARGRTRQHCPRTRRQWRRYPLSVERLEDRWVPSFALRFSTDGGATFSPAVQDNAAGDFNPAAGIIQVNIGALTLVGSVSGGTSTPISVVNLQVSGAAAAGSYDLVVQGSLDGLQTAPPPLTLTNTFGDASLPVGGTNTTRCWIDDNNGLFATTGGGIVLDTSNLPPTSPATSNFTFSAATPYSITAQIRSVFTSVAGNETVLSLLSNSRIVPSPVANPNINTVAGATVVVGSGVKLTDTAVLSGGNNPTGTITFTLYSPSNVPVYTDVVTVSGNGTYDTSTGTNPGGYLPTVPGTYVWTATYSGDSNNSPANDQGGPAEQERAVDARITIAPDDVNEVGQPHTFVVTVQQDDGLPGGAPGGDAVTGFGPASGKSVTVTLANSGGAAASPAGPFTLTTDVGGQAQVTFSSATAGQVTGNASTSFTIDGAAVTRDTDPATATLAGPGGSGPAVKKYVDASIAIAPNDVNEVGQPHTFTITVTAIPSGATPVTIGTPGVSFTGPAPATVGAVTFVSLVGNVATYTVAINNPTAGVFTINASDTITMDGVTVTRDTDPATAVVAGPGGSGPATKRYVDARIILSPLTATNPTNNPHTITATVQQDDGLMAGAPGGDAATGFGPAPNGTLVTFGLVNSSGATASFVGGNTGTTTGGITSVQINSATAGTVTINGATIFVVGGVSLTRDTDPLTGAIGAGPGGSGPAVKTYVAAAVDIEKYVKGVMQCPGGEGLTPGFWKTHSIYGPAGPEAWTPTGYSPDQSYNAIFGVSIAGNPTLLQALNTGGGGVNALLRHSTAALLNAAHPNVDYAFSVAQVISMTQAAINSGNAALIESTKDTFAKENEKGADLSDSTMCTTPAPGFGDDADNPPGPTFPVGSQALFTYVVTNPGQTELYPVVVVDDNETPGVPGDDFSPTPTLGSDNVHNVGDDDLDGRLDPGEVWLYSYTKTVVAGQHTNIATVTGTPVDSGGNPIGGNVTDSDAANWNAGTTPPVGAIDIEKYVKPTSSPTTGGEGLTPGFWKTHSIFGPAGPEAWTPTGYGPTQSYNAVFGVSVAGSPTLLGALNMGGGGINALLRHSTAALLNAAHPNVEYAFTIAQVISMTQAAINSGNAAQIEATKDTFAAENEKGADLSTGSSTPTPGFGLDGDTPPGLIVPIGSQVTFTYVVTNPGQAELFPVVVVDDNETPGSPGDDFNPTSVLSDATHNIGDDDLDGRLDPGEVWLYTYAKTVTAGQHTNIAKATGTPVDNAGTPIGAPVTDSDAANWLGQVSSLGDFVWQDMNANGLQDAGEAGINGVVVQLLNSGSTVIATTTTATNGTQTGYYQFTGLAPGSYTVQIAAGNFAGGGALAGFTASPSSVGSNRAIDSNGSPAPVTLAAGESNQTIDFGYYKAAGVNGIVYCDTNLNGVYDAGEDLDAGAVVTLTGGGVTKTATSGANGAYQFTNLAPGTYTLTLTAPSSGHLAEVTHGAVVIPANLSATLASGGSVTGKNFAEIEKGSISGTVYLDVNDSGIQGDTAGEVGIANVTVTLTGMDYTGAAVSKTTTTDASGKYSLTGLMPSNSTGYTVKETQPAGFLDGLETVGTLNGVKVGTATGGDGIAGIVLPGCDNNAINYLFGEHGIFHGLTATIGFWHNANGQALIKSFGTTSSGQTLANWLATTMPNLFGKNAPAFNVNSTIGTNLTGRSNTDVANYFLSLFNVSGQKSYAQVLATSFAVLTTTSSLNTGNVTVNGTNSRALAAKYGFVLSTAGSGAATYTVAQADWAAFGITSSSGATKTVSQLLSLTNKYAVNGKLNNGNTTLITETSHVFDTINNQGDILG